MPAMGLAIFSIGIGFFYLDHNQIEVRKFTTREINIFKMCNPPTSLSPVANSMWNIGTFIVDAMTIITYCISFGLIAYKSKFFIVCYRNMKSLDRKTADISKTMDVERKAMKSLKAIIIIFIVTRYTGTLVVNILSFTGFYSL